MLGNLIWLAGLVGSVAANEIAERCGNPEPTMEDIAVAANLSKVEGLEARYEPHPIEIPTWFHIVAYDETFEGGWLSDHDISEQLRVINEDFAPQNISFSYQGTTRTINYEWAHDRDGQNLKNTVRRGGYDTLNLYFMPYVSGNLGYCTLPRDYPKGSDAYKRDGCVNLSASVPGGYLPPYDLGRTATHEIGHWLDLFHTFQGGCGCVGDLIHDTPAQASPSSGCPVGRNSCPNRPGLDPIHNFMDYSYDACMEEFTEGQAFRMRSAWYNLRLGK